MRGTVTDDIISTICNLQKVNLDSIMKEIQTQEPSFYKWAKSSVKEDLNQIKFSGVVFQSEESARGAGTILLQAKMDGFLIALMAQDREWKDKLFVNGTDKEDEIPFQVPIMSLMAGKLDKNMYDSLAKTMTDEEKNDPEHWKNKAIQAWEENNRIKEASTKARNFLKKQKNKSKGRGGNTSPGIADGDVQITP